MIRPPGGAYDEDWRVRLRNDRVWQAEKQSEEHPYSPPRPWKIHAADHEADSEAIEERSEQRRRLVWEVVHGQHHGDHQCRRAPFLLRVLFKAMGGVATGERDEELAQLKGRMPKADFEAFSVPGRLEAFGASMREAMRQGTKWPVREMGLYVRDFGFDPATVPVPVHWLHGEADANAPIQLACRAVSSIPGAQLVRYPGEAHLSTLCNHFADAARLLRQSLNAQNR